MIVAVSMTRGWEWQQATFSGQCDYGVMRAAVVLICGTYFCCTPRSPLGKQCRVVR